MKWFCCLFVLLFAKPTCSYAQNGNNCFKVRYLDFFGLDTMTIQWPQSELDGLLTLDFATDKRAYVKKTNFLIPMIVAQLKGFYPSCPTKSDTVNYIRLLELYCKIRQLDMASIMVRKTIAQQLYFVRHDFYKQVLNDSILPFMSYTNDDGPFYGQVVKLLPSCQLLSSRRTIFGSLIVTLNGEKICLTAFNRKKKELWSRMMTGKEDKSLPNLSFTTNAIEKTSLGYKVYLRSNGEQVTLYLKNNAAFGYYFHSW